MASRAETYGACFGIACASALIVLARDETTWLEAIGIGVLLAIAATCVVRLVRFLATWRAKGTPQTRIR